MMNKIIIVTIIVLSLVFSCNTVKNNKEKNDVKINNPLTNTCWAIDYKLKNGDSIKMNMKVNLQFKDDDICNISGMQAPYNYEEGGFYMAGDYYKIIILSEKELKVAKYLDDYVRHIEIYHRIDCDSVNKIFEGFEFNDGSRKI